MRSKPLELAGALGHATADKRLEILRRVAQVGSISQAARDAGVSYKAAWQALDTLTNLAGAALVERAVGGAGGGGARLTTAGAELLRTAEALGEARDAVLGRLAAKGPGHARLGALALRTSMRNELPCRVQAVRKAGGAVEVALRLPGGGLLASRITNESVQLLGLARGSEVLALCKATAVEIRGEAAQGDTRNRLTGIVARLSRARSGGEAAISLADGLSVVGFARAASGLALRGPAVACVDASAIVIAVAG